MKILNITLLLIFAICVTLNAQNDATLTSKINEPQTNRVQVINVYDSVFFDLSAAIINGNTVTFPVYFRSDDVINALDFSFKYDHTKLEYDTTLNMTGYIDALSFYNVNDSTVRLTSYSFSQPYTVDTILFLVKFTILNGVLCSNALNSSTALLNGDACSINIIECLNNSIDEFEVQSPIKLFPNPAHNYIKLQSDQLTWFELISANGIVLEKTENPNMLKEFEIDLHNLSRGVYFIRSANKNKVYTTKLLIN